MYFKKDRSVLIKGGIVLSILGSLIGCSSNSNSVELPYNTSFGQSLDDVKKAVTDNNISKIYNDTELVAIGGNDYLGLDIGQTYFEFDDDDKLDHVTIDVAGIKPKKIVDAVNEKYGKPIHMSNYNDMTKTDDYIVWDLNDNKRIYYQYNPQDLHYPTSNQLRFASISKDDKAECKKYMKLEKNRTKAEKNLFNETNKRLKLINHPITDAQKKYGATYQKSDGEKGSYGLARYVENTKINNKDYTFVYKINNPYSDNPTVNGRFGIIEYLAVEKQITDDYSLEDFKKEISGVFGKLKKDESNHWSTSGPDSVSAYYDEDSKTCSAYISTNPKFALIYPEYGSDNSTKKINVSNVSINPTTLEVQDSDEEREVSANTTVYDECLKEAKRYLLVSAKYPETLEYGSDSYVTIKKKGEKYFVSGTFRAQNDFGITATKHYLISIKRTYSDGQFDYKAGAILELK